MASAKKPVRVPPDHVPRPGLGLIETTPHLKAVRPFGHIVRCGLFLPLFLYRPPKNFVAFMALRPEQERTISQKVGADQDLAQDLSGRTHHLVARLSDGNAAIKIAKRMPAVTPGAEAIRI